MRIVAAHWIGLIALLAGVLITLPVYHSVRDAEVAAAQSQFDRRAREAAASVAERFSDYEQLLRSGAGLFAAHEQVTREQWRDFTRQLRLDRRFPGTQGFGFARWLGPADVPAFVDAVRAEGFGSFDVHPGGAREAYAPIEFLEPFDARNRRAFGYDMYSEPVRREAMARARDGGQPALTGGVTLQQETEIDPQQGALMYMPLYAGGDVPESLAQRRARLVGFVYSPLRMGDLMQGVLGSSLDDLGIRIYDGADAVADRLMYQSRSLDAAQSPPRAVWSTQLALGGRVWRFDAIPLMPLVPAFSQARFALAMGGVISVLVAVVIWAFASAQVRAKQLAARMTGAYRDAQQRLQAIVDSTADAILTVDSVGRITSSNRAAERLFRSGAVDLRQHDFASLLPEYRDLISRFQKDPGDPSLKRVETEARTVDGTRFGAEVTVTRLAGDERRPAFLAAIRDISDLRQARMMLAEAHSLRESILSHAPFAIIATDADGIITEMNPAAERMLWYQKGELVGQATISIFLNPVRSDSEPPDDGGDRGRQGASIDGLLAKARRGFVDEREWSYVRKDGSRVLVNQVVTALRDSDGELIGFLAIAYDITERKRAEDYIRHLAHHDALTELPNRVLFRDRLEVAIQQAKRSRTKVAVLMVDLDHFKRINDSLGHHVGDELLVEVTERLRNSVRAGDTVARMGGDEFVMLLPGVHTLDDAIRVARSVVDGVPRPITVGLHELHVTPSVGICMYPDDGQDTATLLKNADTAMYHAKDHGRNGYSVFSWDMLRASEDRMAMESSLRKAIAQQRLVAHYQPLISIVEGEVTGMEALLRWPREDGGLVSPDVFIPIAEDTGLIDQIGDLLIRGACRDAMAAAEELGRPISVAVNVAPRQFHDKRFPEKVARALADSGLAPQLLTLEITERMLVRDPVEVAKILGGLRQLGVGVAIDDFGTGYSSLAYISQFPLNKLKIDRSFVRDLGEDPSDVAVIDAVIAMGHSLNLRIIGEGVESTIQLDHLIARGCDEVQGFMFSAAVPIDEFSGVVHAIERQAYFAGSGAGSMVN
ncbi:MAG: EAL domain-containing protein [Nevskiales bacterium]|nr:EAL domain-containing protein [Nevskiales bacterium]